MAVDPVMIPKGLERIPGHWKYFQLDEVCDGVVDCPHSTPTLADAGPLMVRTQDVLKGVFRVDEAVHVTEETYQERIARAEPQYGDLLYSREGTYFGIAAEVPDGTQVCLGQRMVLIRPSAEIVYFRYLRYWLNSPQLASHIHGYRDGSVAERLNMSTIRVLPVALPPKSEQQSIANILGSLDDKIELNRRMNGLLEGMARAIFKAWFIDFEPIKAKAAGATSFPGMPQHVFDQLPNVFVTSELGEIPEGWDLGTLGDYCKVNEVTAKKNDLPSEIKYINISSVTVGRLDAVERVSAEDAPGRARRRVRHGDTIWSCVRPNRKSYLFVHSPSPNCIVSTGFAVLSPTGFAASYLYQLVTRPEFVEYLVANATGSAYPAVLPEHFERATVLVPPGNVRTEYENLSLPLMDLRACQERESRELAAIRDTLLPKLISGEIPVSTANGGGDGG